MSNRAIADRLAEATDLLEQQQADGFRVAAYRRAAATVRGLDRDLAAILERDGVDGLERIPTIGRGIASAIEEMLRTGRWHRLERLRGESDPEALFQTIPGIGPGIARRIVEQLHVESLPGLELAAHDGRLESVPGLGRRRAAAIRAVLSERLSRSRRGRAGTPGAARAAVEPGVALLLSVDARYRERAGADRLPKIAPKRFNPRGEAWLPVMHHEQDGWSFTCLFSNTALAHRLGRNSDWVVIFFHQDDGGEHQRTVVSETRGPLRGRRVVRGRERECARHYGLGSERAHAQRDRS